MAIVTEEIKKRLLSILHTLAEDAPKNIKAVDGPDGFYGVLLDKSEANLVMTFNHTPVMYKHYAKFFAEAPGDIEFLLNLAHEQEILIQKHEKYIEALESVKKININPAEIWDDGASTATEHMIQHQYDPGTNNGPVDPPYNPWLGGWDKK